MDMMQRSLPCRPRAFALGLGDGPVLLWLKAGGGPATGLSADCVGWNRREDAGAPSGVRVLARMRSSDLLQRALEETPSVRRQEMANAVDVVEVSVAPL